MARILDTVKPLIDRGTSIASSTLEKVPGPAGALARRLGGGGPKPAMTDPTLKSRVESALYRVPGITRSRVKVTVAEGVVTVHGEAANQAQMATVETTVRGVPEVRGYESQLHLPKTPAPSTPKAGRRQAARKKPAASTKAGTRGRTERVNREKTTAKAEPAPKDVAAKGEGRQPAPLGSNDPGPDAPATGGKSSGRGSQADSPASNVTSGSEADS